MDELRGTTGLVPLKTLVTDVKLAQGSVDENKSNLFIIPGLEGHHERSRSLCERLKLPAFVLQPGLDRPDETPRELAWRYSKVLLEQCKLKTNFYLLGYEFGIVIALELASILENHGLSGTVYCLGDGPEEMKVLMESELSEFESEKRLQTSVMRHMLTLMGLDSAASVEESAPGGGSTWQESVDMCIRTLLGRLSHSSQYTRGVLEAAYSRISTARSYSAAPRALRSRLVLLRARSDTGKDVTSSLQRYSQSDVITCDLMSPLSHAAFDLQVPAIINRYLDNDILGNYEKYNLCETY